MSAVAAQSVAYVLIPGNEGFPSTITGAQAQSLISRNDNDDTERASRFSELLEQRGAGHVPFWFSGADVIIRGDVETAWGISKLVHELPNMMPTAKANNDNVVAFAPRAHIADDFAKAVNPLLKAPDMGADFKHSAARPAPAPFARRAMGMERHAA